MDTAAFPATAVGYGQLLEWACRFGPVPRAGVEGTGSYGAGLCRYLLAQHIEVIRLARFVEHHFPQLPAPVGLGRTALPP
ncbi:hypothetical protein ACH4SK_41095 [Streptomyces inhibens]|uniref:hypothetical protein n=1 Tax=Streptomyces inhibens TaxID=2293571 RepID=UPI00379B9038